MKRGGKRIGAGRKTGGQNKRTEQWLQFTDYCMNGGLEKFQTEIDKLSGKDYVIAFINLLEFHKPKLNRTAIIGDKDNPIQVTFKPIGNRSTGK